MVLGHRVQGRKMKAAIHFRKPPGTGGVRVIRLVTGEARYQATGGGKYLGTFMGRAGAEAAIANWMETGTVSYDDRAQRDSGDFSEVRLGHVLTLDERVHKHRANSGERSHLSKLKEEDVRAIRRRHEGGETPAELAREFGVTGQTVASIVRRQTWRSVE